MVGSAGNAPVRRFQHCLTTPDLQSGCWITSGKLACRAVARTRRIIGVARLRHASARQPSREGRKIKGPASANRRPQDPFQQRTNTSCYLVEIPTHGFTVVLSVFGGTPLLKPLKCKIRLLVRAAMRRSRAHHTGDQPMLVCAIFNLSPNDITWMSVYVCSRSLSPLVAAVLPSVPPGNKKPCLLS
jgi:hypothetical protein